jgi:hypothetical protein
MKGLISQILILAITVASTIIIINTAGPILEQGKISQSVNDAKQILKTMDVVLNQLVFEANGAKRAININIPEGRLVFSGRSDKVKIALDKTGILKPGVSVQEENIVFQGGGTLDAYESDIMNDGQQDLVLENSAVLFAVKKLGNQSEPAFVNTSNVITMIRNKRQDVNMTPNSGIFVNEKPKSSYGYGYTELAEQNNIQTGSILMHINSTANITYDAVFTLSSSSDFIDLEIRNVKVSK